MFRSVNLFSSIEDFSSFSSLGWKECIFRNGFLLSYTNGHIYTSHKWHTNRWRCSNVWSDPWTSPCAFCLGIVQIPRSQNQNVCDYCNNMSTNFILRINGNIALIVFCVPCKLGHSQTIVVWIIDYMLTNVLSQYCQILIFSRFHVITIIYCLRSAGHRKCFHRGRQIHTFCSKNITMVS